MPKRSRKRPLSIHDYLFPRRSNSYRPHLFRTASVTAILIGVFVIQALYFAQIGLVFPKTNFLASVLPGALVSLTNTDRASGNLGAVSEDELLTQAAQAAADDMASNGYFAHVSPDGKTPWYWLKQAGYNYQYAGENLAVNFTDSDQVETAWMNSPTHRANIMKSQYTKVGIGVANGTYEGKDATFVVQFFATPAAAPAAETTPTEPAVKPKVQEAAPTVPKTTDSGEIAIVPTKAPTQVLGVETTQVASQTAPVSFFQQVLTSPTHTLLYILLALAGVVAVLLIVEISIKMRLKYVEMTSGGLALLVALVIVIIVNICIAPKVEVPSSAQQASTQS